MYQPRVNTVSRAYFKESLQLHRNEKMSDLKKICIISLKFPTTFSVISLTFTFSTIIHKSLQAQLHRHILSFLIHSTFSQHFSVSTTLFHSRTSKFTTTTAQLPFYNCKLHFTTAEIGISCTLKYALTVSIIVTTIWSLYHAVTVNDPN